VWAAANGDQAVENAEIRSAELQVDEQRLGELYDADAVVDLYVRGDGAVWVPLRAVATQAQSLFVPATLQDAEKTASEFPEQSLQLFGEVECRVAHGSPTEETAETVQSECMRRNAELTIWLGPTNLLAADLAVETDLAWEALGGTDDPPVLYTSSTAGQFPVPALPERLGADYLPVTEIPEYALSLARYASYRVADVEALESVSGGLADAQYYSSTEYGSAITLYSYLADSPPPFVWYRDPENLDALAALNEVLEFGDVTCLVSNSLVRPDGDPADLDPQTEWCHVSNGGLTVMATELTGEMRDDVSIAVDALGEAFSFIVDSR
jgi:hypothetical protein